ncbi:hypothetical protein ACFYPN_30740 [Streptomyces sp. NPDC005576]
MLLQRTTGTKPWQDTTVHIAEPLGTETEGPSLPGALDGLVTAVDQ